jgi:hypothetical protein
MEKQNFTKNLFGEDIVINASPYIMIKGANALKTNFLAQEQ